MSVGFSTDSVYKPVFFKLIIVCPDFRNSDFQWNRPLIIKLFKYAPDIEPEVFIARITTLSPASP